MNLPENVLVNIRAHAEQEYANRDANNQPRESCGLVVIVKGKARYLPIKNVAEASQHFQMDAEGQAAAEDLGEVVMVVHSHPNIPPLPSQADLVSCEASGLPWLIINWPTAAMYQFQPTGYKPPLYGRQFSHGVLDCYSFIQDYYRESVGITLPDFPRDHEWWLKGKNLYLEGFESAGFIDMKDGPKKPHDVLLMQVMSPVPNHGAIWLGDGNIGHHQTGRLSSRDVYGGGYAKATVKVLRHKDLM